LHPVLGYSRMHQGVDFAAPTGTPVIAAGSGTIEWIGRNAGFGNFIRIRHSGQYQTAYAHLHTFAPGLRTGSRVSQGQVIGQVGSTGLSTGPHLHFEVHVNGRPVNPNDAKLPVGRQLEGGELANFRGRLNSYRNMRPMNRQEIAAAAIPTATMAGSR
jgi:murein DD-endopeptidase MepM/ murein hydrolase activator NlpD